MKFDISGSFSYLDVNVEVENVTVKLGLMGPAERETLARTLREAADELCPDDVPYKELESAYEREQEREN